MRFLSTRGGDQGRSFQNVLTRPLGQDGGLFLPESWPAPRDWSAFRGEPFPTVAAEVLTLLAEPWLSKGEAHELCDAAFASFRHPETVPVADVAGEPLLELFHGPTLAFKDVAMQVIARLFEKDLKARGETMTVIVATSGDTGGAAVEALAGREGLRLCVLHPHNRISQVQRRFMTTGGAENVVNLAVEGTFDDCQAIVKGLFADHAFANDVRLGGVNSINWARIAAQVSYYITASLAFQGGGPAHFSVPTGNFGDVFAGYVAKTLGAPMGQLIVAVNENDILDRALKTGRYEKEGVTATASPSMDIEVASNFERALYEASGRDSAATASLMNDLKEGHGFTIPEATHEALRRDYRSARVSGPEVEATIRSVHEAAGTLLDPHSAIGLAAARRLREEGLKGDIVTLATAHPAKFPEAVKKASGQTPELPEEIAAKIGGDEHYTVVPADQDAVREQLLQ